MWIAACSLDERESTAQMAPMRGRLQIIAVLLLSSSSAAVAADDQPICADRPSKSTGECTVPFGHVQVETGLVDWTHDHSDGVTSNLTTYGSSLIKYGISARADVELGLTPVESVHTRGGGVDEHASGFGDLILRVKYKLTSDEAPVLVALDPFVKLPTASHRMGNGKVEGGLLVATSGQLGKSALTLSLDPELDLVADAAGDGRHLATQQVVNLGFAVSDRVGLSTELWAKWDWDPAGTGKQASWDVAATYLATRKLQLDAGANFGINRQTPGVELYTGLSARF